MRSLAAGALLACALPALARAQDRLTISEAIQDAMARNRSLQSAHAGVREADARLEQARSAYFPRVSFTESWQRGNQPVFVFSSLLASRRFASANFAIDSLNSPDPTAFFHSALSFDQVLFDGGRTGASVSAAGLQRDIATLSVDEATLSVALAATEAFGRALTARAERRAAEAAGAEAEEDLARARLRRDAGSLNDADVLAVNAHLASVRQRRIQAAGGESVAKAELNRLMGSPIDRDYDVEEPAALPTPVPEASSVQALFAEADRQRADLKRLAATERLAETVRRQARAAWYPQIAAQAGVEANGASVGDRASSWVIGGDLRWTLSVGGAERAQRAAAIESSARARFDHEDARAAVQVEIVSAMRQLETAIARRDAGQAASAYARENQRIVRDRFDAGLAGTDALLRASTAVLDAEAGRAAALADVLVSRTRLDRAVGRAPTLSTRPPS